MDRIRTEPARSSLSRRLRRLASLAALLLAAAVALSCSSRIGWGVVLWTVKGTSAKAGAIVPVYLKSNINHVYLIGLEAENEKIEVPIWRIETFKSKRDAQKRVDAFGDLKSIYMIATRDGLPVRETPSNLAKRVYRLREDEIVKALAKTEGDVVYTGGQALPGDWYKVLTADGTEGYVFSYTMQLFDELSGEPPAQEVVQTDSATIDAVFSNTWRPAWYRRMLEDDTIDPDYFQLRFGLFGDAVHRQIRVELPAVSRAFNYGDISQDGDWLIFGSSGLRLRQDGPDSIVANWGPALEEPSDDYAGWASYANSARFITVRQDIREAIRLAQAARAEQLRRFFAQVEKLYGSAGSGLVRFQSEDAGTLDLWPSGLYSWKGTQNLPAGFAPAGEETVGEQTGSAVFGLRISDQLGLLWHGGFSLYSDAAGKRTDYLYRLDASGIVIARAAPALPGQPTEELEKRFSLVALAHVKSR